MYNNLKEGGKISNNDFIFFLDVLNFDVKYWSNQ